MKKLILFLAAVSPFLSFAQTADTNRINRDLQELTHTEGYRNYRNLSALNATADYIKKEFEKSSDSVWLQAYEVEGKIYQNIICSFGREHRERIVVGAHYDVCGEQQGADDNASGVAGLLELSRLLKDRQPNCRIDLVAYTLEEPPFFRSTNMGSYVHAQYLHDIHANVKGMISLEMIGYFSEEKHSQQYPIGLLKMFYGNKGNYIAVVRKMGGGKFGRRVKHHLKHQQLIRTKSISAPKKMTGIDFSDHLNYWKFGFKAVMITDTSFYRNFHYHEKGDTIEKLDRKKMGEVITSVHRMLLAWK